MVVNLYFQYIIGKSSDQCCGTIMTPREAPMVFHRNWRLSSLFTMNYFDRASYSNVIYTRQPGQRTTGLYITIVKAATQIIKRRHRNNLRYWPSPILTHRTVFAHEVSYGHEESINPAVSHQYNNTDADYENDHDWRQKRRLWWTVTQKFSNFGVMQLFQLAIPPAPFETL